MQDILSTLPSSPQADPLQQPSLARPLGLACIPSPGRYQLVIFSSSILSLFLPGKLVGRPLFQQKFVQGPVYYSLSSGYQAWERPVKSNTNGLNTQMYFNHHKMPMFLYYKTQMYLNHLKIFGESVSLWTIPFPLPSCISYQQSLMEGLQISECFDYKLSFRFELMSLLMLPAFRDAGTM